MGQLHKKIPLTIPAELYNLITSLPHYLKGEKGEMMKQALVMGMMAVLGGLAMHAKQEQKLDKVTISTSDPSVYWSTQKDGKDVYFYCDDTKTFCAELIDVALNSGYPGWKLVTPEKVTVGHKDPEKWRVENASTEGNSEGHIYVRDIYLEAWINGKKSEFSPNVLVPEGTLVTYKAKQGKAPDQKDIDSKWAAKKSGGVSSEAKDTFASIQFTPSYWNVGTGWFGDPAEPKPQIGTYTLIAKPADESTFPWEKAPSAQMDVAVGAFIQHPNDTSMTSPFVNGFDNYTNWKVKDGQTEEEKATDYYGARKGRCTLPYASIWDWGNGCVALELSGPTSLPYPLDLTSSMPSLILQGTTADMTLSPVIFTSTEVFAKRIAMIKAEKDDLTFAKLEVHSFPYKAETCLFVLVGRPTTIVLQGTVYVEYPQPPDNTTLNSIQMFVKQGGRALTFFPPVEFKFEQYPANKVWMRNAIRNDYENLKVEFQAKEGNKYQHIRHLVFIIAGWEDWAGNTTSSSLGRADIGGRFSWVFNNSHIANGGTASPIVFGHELVHNYNVGEGYNPTTKQSGPDLENLMNNTLGDKCFRLRKSQWHIMFDYELED